MKKTHKLIWKIIGGLETMSPKLKVLWWSDFLCATGFGQVAHNIVKELDKTDKYEFHIVAINHDGDFYDQQKYPYIIHPAVSALSMDERYKNVYGGQKFVDYASSGFFDIVYILQDTFIAAPVIKALLEVRSKLPPEKRFAIIYYAPIDGVPKQSWIEEAICKVDFPVTYTKFAKEECMKLAFNLQDLPYIYHGVDKEVFKPMDVDHVKRFRDSFFTKHKDKFIVLNVNRNQPRKDLHRTFAAFKIFHQNNPNSFLFILAQTPDVGGDLIEIARQYDLHYDVDWACPPPGVYNANQGYPIEMVNMLYNACDVVVSSTIGEGWGLSCTEAMAVKKPVIFPKNTSLVEMIGEHEERGWFAKSGETMNDYICMGSPDNNILRPIVNVYDMARVLEYVYNHPEEAKLKAERAFNEVWQWEQIGDQWKEIFQKAENKLNVIRSIKKIGVNEKCPCLSGKKYKDCCGK